MTSYIEANNLSKDVEIKVRRMDFDFERTPIERHWFDNNPVLTHFFNAMSSVFPDGERFFIDTVRNFEKDIQDPVLKKQIKGFIGQEAHHGKEHETFNNYIESQGYPMGKVASYIKTAFNRAKQRLSKRRQLAITIALEHFTAILADYTLSNPDLFDLGDNVFQELIAWHAIEETEHKAVAFDVYQAVGGGYWTRVLTMASVTFGFFANIIAIQSIFLRIDHKNGRKFTWQHFKDAMVFFWRKDGPFRTIAADYFAYYRRDFHPWDQDNRELVGDWKAKINQYVLT